MPNPNFMSGVPELLILRLLEGREMYGYELVQAIRHETGDAIRFGEGVIYPLLHALERDGALESRRKPVNGRTRVYYAVTHSGAMRLGALIAEWQRLARAIGSLMREAGHVPAAI